MATSTAVEQLEKLHIASPVRGVSLSSTVSKSVEGYLDQLDENSASNLYELVMDVVREPMMRSVLQKLRGNQSAAARIMGISRGTLRKLMKRYQMLD